ncbi:MAG TPA: pepsin-like aspartic protease [Candidatus Binatia bacterium]|nr:pepsin-like aspartic protease [Candidatus Binatia bacterium]
MAITPRGERTRTAAGAWLLGIVALFAGVAPAAIAADVPIVGTQLDITDNPRIAARRAVAFTARDPAISLDGIDPTVSGLTVELVNPNPGVAWSAVFDLPAGGWKAIGTPVRGYRYRDARLVHGPVRAAVLKAGRLVAFTAAGGGVTFTLAGGPQGSIGVNVDAGDTRYCALFGGTVRKDTSRRFVARHAPAPSACATLTPTTTTTTSSTSTTLPTGLTNLPLAGCASAGYTAGVTLGGSQTFALVIDSGSTTLAVASAQCAQCAGLSPLYSPGPTAADTGLTTASTYGDGSSWSGHVFDDLVAASTAPSVRMAFAAIDAQSSFFVPAQCTFVPVPNSSQGILGLGGPGLAATGTDAYVTTLAASAVPDTFAVQLCGVGGRLWLGGYDPAAATAPPKYTPLVATSPYYAVTVSDLLLGGTSLGFGAATFGDTLVDTGTTQLLVPASVYTALTTAVAGTAVFQQNFGSASWFGAGTCNKPAQHLTKAQLDQMLPALTLAFPTGTPGTTFSVTLPATDSYLLQQDDTLGQAYYCPGIGASTLTILGANALHTLLTVFDPAGSRIGFAPQQGCPLLASETRAALTPPPGPAVRPAPPYRRRPGA